MGEGGGVVILEIYVQKFQNFRWINMKIISKIYRFKYSVFVWSALNFITHFRGVRMRFARQFFNDQILFILRLLPFQLSSFIQNGTVFVS